MVDYCVCAEPIEERGVYNCGHALCLSCTLKKRVLMKDNQCPYCRSPSKQVAIVASASSELSEARIDFQPGNLKVENPELVKSLRHILQFPCPECDAEQKNYKTLRTHVKNEHDKALCDVCTKHEYNFSDEYRLFEPSKIKEHLKKQHIFCKYCHTYFYGITEFSKHCRESHIGCGICERRDPEHPLYFKEYDQLFEHYKAKHHLCMVPTCLENKHIVFGTVLELRKHMIEAHRGLLNNSRQSQQIDLEQLSLDAEEAQASTSHGNEPNEYDTEKSRYEARLDISSNHDQEKISKLHGANSTFLNKKVPAAIFIATYESVLSGVPKSEITALLIAFKRAYKSQLTEEASRALGFTLSQRSKAETDEEEHRNFLKYKSNPNQAGSSVKKPSSRGPTPTDVREFSWGFSVPSAGLSDLSNLPELGRKNKPNNSSPAFSWQPRKATPTSSSNALQNLPSLAKKSSTSSQSSLSSRQTSTPLSYNNRTGQSSFFNSLRSNTLPTSASATSSSSSSSSSSSAPLSSSSSIASAQPHNTRVGAARNQPVQVNSLPSLPGKPKSGNGDKKRQRNVIRIV